MDDNEKQILAGMVSAAKNAAAQGVAVFLVNRSFDTDMYVCSSVEADVIKAFTNGLPVEE